MNGISRGEQHPSTSVVGKSDKLAKRESLNVEARGKGDRRGRSGLVLRRSIPPGCTLPRDRYLIINRYSLRPQVQ